MTTREQVFTLIEGLIAEGLVKIVEPETRETSAAHHERVLTMRADPNRLRELFERTGGEGVRDWFSMHPAEGGECVVNVLVTWLRWRQHRTMAIARAM